MEGLRDVDIVHASITPWASFRDHKLPKALLLLTPNPIYLLGHLAFGVWLDVSLSRVLSCREGSRN